MTKTSPEINSSIYDREAALLMTAWNFKLSSQISQLYTLTITRQQRSLPNLVIVVSQISISNLSKTQFGCVAGEFLIHLSLCNDDRN